MNIVKRISVHRALRAEVQAWCADTRERLIIRRQDPRTIPDPPDGYRKFPEAVELENERTRALCRIKNAEHEATGVAIEKLRHARIAEPEHEQYLALCQILPSEVQRLSYMDQQWFKARLRDLVIERTARLIDEARRGDALAFDQVVALIASDADPTDPNGYRALTGSLLPLPTDWDDIQARCRTTPPPP